MRLKDKIAIVTGGASGFGKGIVEKIYSTRSESSNCGYKHGVSRKCR